MTGYKINIHKSIVFLSTNNEQSENEVECNPCPNRRFQRLTNCCYNSNENATQNNQTFLKRQNKIEIFTFPNFKMYDKTTIIET